MEVFGDDTQVRYLSIQVTRDGISELDGNRQVIFIPREQILRLEIKVGTGTQRPFLQLAVAVILILVAAGFAIHVWSWWVSAAWTIDTATIAAPPLLLLTSAWLIYDALKKRSILEIRTAKGNRKLLFGGSPEAAKLAAFVAQVSKNFPYTIVMAGVPGPSA